MGERMLGCAVLAASLLPRGALAEAPARDTSGSDGLLDDIERIIVAEGDSWFLDDDGYRAVYPTVLESVCRASPSARALAAQALRDRVRGRSARAIFEAAGQQWTDEAEQVLLLERQLHALELALAGASADCPYWVRPRAGFTGRQSGRDRWALSFETRGNVLLSRVETRWTLAAGGAGRALISRGFGSKLSLLVGPELGGSAMLESTGPTSEVVLNYVPAVPVLAQLHHGRWHYDLELAPIGLFQSDNYEVSYGARAGLGLGVSALRLRGLIPSATLALACEYFPEGDARPATYFFGAGLRVAALWAP